MRGGRRAALLAVLAGCAGGSGNRMTSETEADSIGSSGGPGSTTSSVATDFSGSTSSSDAGSAGSLCGNAVVDGDEECDEGGQNSDDGACTSLCRSAVCGDALVFEGEEACDDGNDDETDDCTSLCAAPACDDQIVSGDESDVDCGGSCEACVAGENCNGNADCLNQVCVMTICAPAASCAELLLEHPGLSDGMYTIDPNGGSADDATEVLCDMSIDGGGWTALAANGDNAVAETTSPDDCYPLISGETTEGCGDPSNIMADFTVSGAQQAALSWQYLMAIAYGDGGYVEKLAFFAVDFGAPAPTADERFNGTAYVPAGVTTQHGEMACTGASIAHYTRAGTYIDVPTGLANGKGTVFGHDGVTTMNASTRQTFGFTDAIDGGATASGFGIDDYQDGWSCSDTWGPVAVRGARMVVLVR